MIAKLALTWWHCIYRSDCVWDHHSSWFDCIHLLASP